MKLTEHDADQVQKMLWEKFMDALEFNVTDDDEYDAYVDLYDNYIDPKVREAIDLYIGGN